MHLTRLWQEGERREEVFVTTPPSAEPVSQRSLATHQTDRQIATQLNTEGLTTGVGQEFDRVRVRRVRLKYDIPAGCPEMPNPRVSRPRGDGRYSARVAARLLNVSIGTISNWCRIRKLDSMQSVPGSPSWITLTPDIITILRRPVKRSYKKRPSSD